jgi:hypothetical protein
MYKVLKEKGNNQNVTLQNTDTKASIIIGRISIEILNLLERAGHKIDGETLSMKDRWELEVNDEIGKELASKAMTMTKPIRDQRKTEDKPKKENKHIDAMDVLLGLANYK